MSESPKITLNLAALKKPDTQLETEDTNTSKTTAMEEKNIVAQGDASKNVASQNTPEKEEIQEGTPKKIKTSLISLSSLTKKEVPSKNIQKEGQIRSETSEEKSDSATPSIAKNHQESEVKNTTDNTKTPEEKIEFTNYTSHFEKESKNVFKSIQNFRYAPKTRMGFIISLLGLTVLSIASLMLLFPEKHSLSIYKTSILYIYEQKTEKAEENSDILPASQNTNIIPEIETKPEPISEEDPFDIEQHRKEKLQDHLFQKYNN